MTGMNQCGLRGSWRHKLIIGSFNNGGSEIHPGRNGSSGDLIMGCCRKINLPYMKEFPDGHWDSRAVLTLGQTVTLSAANAAVDIISDE